MLVKYRYICKEPAEAKPEIVVSCQNAPRTSLVVHKELNQTYFPQRGKGWAMENNVVRFLKEKMLSTGEGRLSLCWTFHFIRKKLL